MPGNWWSAPSPWAPQSHVTIWSRQMDWVALACAENNSDVHAAARTIGVEVTTLMRRIDRLQFAANLQHWRNDRRTL